MERRNHQRRKFGRHALLYHPQGFLCPGSITNISLNGLFIMTSDARIRKGSCVEVAIDASPKNTTPLTAKALVVHKMDDGVGLLCENDVLLHELLTNKQ